MIKKLKTYSRLLKTTVNGGNGSKNKNGAELNSIMACELGSLSLGVAGSRIRSWRTVKACSVQTGQ